MTSYAITDVVGDRRMTEAAVAAAVRTVERRRSHLIAWAAITVGAALLIFSVQLSGYLGRVDLRNNVVAGCEFARSQNLDKPAYRRRDCRAEYPPAQLFPIP